MSESEAFFCLFGLGNIPSRVRKLVPMSKTICQVRTKTLVSRFQPEPYSRVDTALLHGEGKSDQGSGFQPVVSVVYGDV